MPQEYSIVVFNAYQQLKLEGKLSSNLIDVTPGKLREECLIVCRERYMPEDHEILRLFFSNVDREKGYLGVLENTPAQTFKQASKVLSGKVTKPGIKYFELLAWLIDFRFKTSTAYYKSFYEEQREEKNLEDNKGHIAEDNGEKDLKKSLEGTSPEASQISKGDVSSQDEELITEPYNDLNTSEPTITDDKLDNPEPSIPNEPPEKSNFKRPIVIVLLLAFLSFALYSYLNFGTNKIYTPANTKEKCMHWIGDSYEPISCADLTSKTPIVAIDFIKLNRFRKINTADTLTKYDLGSVWYAKRYGKVEFYTDSGMHPIDTNRALNPLTEYMLNKYVSSDRHLLNRAGWGAGIFVLILALIGLVYRYEKRNKHYNELNK